VDRIAADADNSARSHVLGCTVKASAWPFKALALLAPAALFAVCVGAPAQGQDVEGVAAIVNDDVISTYDVRQRMRLILATTGVRANQELLMRVQEQALNSLIDERLQLQQAEEFEVEIKQEEVDEAMADLARQNNIAPDEIRRSLAEAGVDARTLEDQLRAEIAWQILVSSRYRPRVRVSNDQINQMLERLAESSSKPSYLISEILIAPTLGESDGQLMARVNAVMEQLNQGASFPAVAREVSAAASAINGGDVSWVRSGEMKPEIENQLLTMSIETFSQPIETQDGYYIIALRDRREATDPERVSLQQVMAPLAPGASADAIAELERSMERAARGVDNCGDLDRITDREPSASISDLGSMAPADLAPEFRQVVDTLSDGEVSRPIRTPSGVVMLALCQRDRIGGADLPSREQVESRLLDQQLSLASRRWLRDLRRDATIETRVGP
jgi:peptidyl-prolyl cis-trans isomerase SurA